MNILRVMAHPDDEMRCLGTMLKGRARGDWLHLVTVGDGSADFAHHPDISQEQAAASGAGEMKPVAEAVAATFTTLSERGGFVYDSADGREKLVRVARQTRADVIFTRYPDDYDADHTVVSGMILHGLMLASDPVVGRYLC